MRVATEAFFYVVLQLLNWSWCYNFGLGLDLSFGLDLGLGFNILVLFPSLVHGTRNVKIYQETWDLCCKMQLHVFIAIM